MAKAIAAYTLSPWHILLLAIVLTGSSFALQGRQGINLADEGYLWYGAQQTAHGKVPLRDFDAYDPGRYYWSAAGMHLFGEGLVALRFSETLFQLLGLWVGLLAASRVCTELGAARWRRLDAHIMDVSIPQTFRYHAFALRNLDCGPSYRRTVIRSNFHGRFFCRPVRLFRQKSRTL